jgi:ribosome maturation factor RimP
VEEVRAMRRDTTDLADALSPVVEAHGLDLVDVEVQGRQLTVFVDREGGVGLDELGDATRDVSAELDRLDPLPGRYTLSLSSPGLERRLRTPGQFLRAVGETVSVRVDGGTDEVRRMTGTLTSVDELGCTLEGPEVPEGAARLEYDRIERARTVFEWGPPARPATAQRKRGKTERVTRA